MKFQKKKKKAIAILQPELLEIMRDLINLPGYKELNSLEERGTCAQWEERVKERTRELEEDASREIVRLPTIIFVHGESFDWGSGNAYDGSILASKGDSVVFTLNYRVGLLGK
ncbi:Neuroligin-1 [Nymphon striatum]|nr:Neuroligin-1 [Nymphon striatum]